MFSYKWQSDYGTSFIAKFYGKWNRFNYCKAAEFHKYDYYNAHDFIGRERKVKRESWYLVSYCTPIIKMQREYWFDSGEIIHTDVFVNEESWNCSATTIHQLSRWLNELDFFRGFDFSYHELKEAMTGTNIHFLTFCNPKEHFTVKRVTSDEIEYIFQEECDEFSLD